MLRNLSTWSHDSEVTPPCSIQALPFGDVLVVRTRKLIMEKVKKKIGQKMGVFEHDAKKENKTKVTKDEVKTKKESINEHGSIPRP